MLSGILFYLLIVGAAWLFRLAYLGWFGSFILWLVILLPPVFALLSLPAMLSMKLGLESPETVSCGEQAELSLVFHTKRRFPVGKVLVRLEITNLYTGKVQHNDFRFDAVASSVGSVRIPSSACGALRIRVLRWSCADVIGLLHLRRANPPAARCVVLPLAKAPETAIAAEALPESQPRMKPKYGGGFAEDHELRAYRPGDSMNSIHWKLSGKTEELIVREPLVPENDKTYVILQKIGPDDRGLQTLLWLSQQLNRHEISHIILSDDLYPVSDDTGTIAALKEILSKPGKAAIHVPLGDAKRIYTIEAGEVSVC